MAHSVGVRSSAFGSMPTAAQGYGRVREALGVRLLDSLAHHAHNPSMKPREALIQARSIFLSAMASCVRRPRR